ncbi:MAG: PIN domain-containing protein [Rhodospirillales bacterium]|nr:PIN domain-containing protein [Rhodospirillales bacterium]
MIILDTNVISELAKPWAEPAVVAWADTQDPDGLFATTVSEAEMLYGVNILAAGVRRDTLRRAVLTVFGALLAGRVLPFDSAAAAEYADWAADRRRVGQAVGMANLQIAAIARARGAAAVATRNLMDFSDFGVPLINPWATP